MQDAALTDYDSNQLFVVKRGIKRYFYALLQWFLFN